MIFYKRHPYPPPIEELDGYSKHWEDEGVRNADYHLFWPSEPYREELDIPIAGCAVRRRRPNMPCVTLKRGS